MSNRETETVVIPDTCKNCKKTPQNVRVYMSPQGFHVRESLNPAESDGAFIRRMHEKETDIDGKQFLEIAQIEAEAKSLLNKLIDEKLKEIEAKWIDILLNVIETNFVVERKKPTTRLMNETPQQPIQPPIPMKQPAYIKVDWKPV